MTNNPDDDPATEEGHSLPSVEAVKSDNELRNGADNKKRQRFLLILGGSVLLLTIIFGVSVDFATESKGTTAKSTGASEFPNSSFKSGQKVSQTPAKTTGITEKASRFEQTQKYLASYWDRAKIEEQGSPQYRAALWISDFDHAQVPLPTAVDYASAFKFLQRYIMAVYYFSLDGESWKFQMNFLSEKSVCHWNFLVRSDPDLDQDTEFVMGVECNENEEIDSIYMPGNHMKGEIPEELGYLLFLNHFSVYWNDISGPIPDSLQFLDELEFLAMEGCQLEGPIPEWINKLTNLKFLDLSDNYMTGTLPSLAALTSMTQISLASNEFVGSLDRFSGMPELDLLDLHGNTFTGPIPQNFGVLENLRYLLLGQNMLSGTVPRSIFEIDELKLLLLDGNDLTGDITGTCNLENAWVSADCEWEVECGECCDLCCEDGEECDVSDLTSDELASYLFSENYVFRKPESED